MKRALRVLLVALIVALAIEVTSRIDGSSFTAEAQSGSTLAKVDPLLEPFLSRLGIGARAPVIITYRAMPTQTEITRLRSLGIMKGFMLRELPMVIVDMNLSQLASVRRQPGVRSVWGNRVMKVLTNESRHFIGVPQMSADREISNHNSVNPGFPISGKTIGVGYIDTGIDATNEDLKLGRKTMQNVIQPLAQGVVSDGGLLLGVGVSISDLIVDTIPGFVPPIYIENAPTSDLESGHGTHGAGVTAGTGANSGGFYGGVASGAHLVGIDTGDDKGLPLVAILTAFDYMMVNQFTHNIRVLNNSWGSSFAASEVDPDNPVNVATRRAHDLNMVVVFAAGNSGAADDAINPYSTMPWTISVAAGEKNGLGQPADFTSIGKNNGTGTDVAGMPADPASVPNLRPDITAPGVRIISTKARTVSPFMNALSVLNNDPQNIPPAFLPYYYSSDGTSFACPHISGVVALMLEANSQLTPDEVVSILRQTATPMPYEEKVVGAGYVDAHNAVRAAMGLSAVDHPADLFPPDTGEPRPEITDPAGDQTGTTAQDIVSCDFGYDAAASELVYTLTLADLSQRTANNQWTLSSKFGAVELFVSAAITETGAATYEYGTVTVLPNGTPNQSNIGPTDSGVISGNQIIMRLSIAKVNQAVGFDVLGTDSKATSARSQILIGASAVGGLLLNADSAAGSDYNVSDSSAGSGGPQPEYAEFTERLTGALPIGNASALVPVQIRRPMLEARLNYHPANQSLSFELLDATGNVIAVANQSGEKAINLSNVAAGNYAFRVSGSPTKNVDFVIKGKQAR